LEPDRAVVRTVKAPHVRKAELLDVAESLFRRRGYSNATVDEIVREAGVAKGTFYHYFRTKDDVLEALAARMVECMAEELRQIAADASRAPVDKLQHMFSAMQRIGADKKGIADDLHSPGNRELHDRNNVEIIRVLGPIFADVIEQGKASGVFDVEDAVSTVQFIMAGSLFLFGEGVFHWSSGERAARTQAMKQLIGRALGMRTTKQAISTVPRRKRRNARR
jgi:AcrR family transcriptional regulator